MKDCCGNRLDNTAQYLISELALAHISRGIFQHVKSNIGAGTISRDLRETREIAISSARKYGYMTIYFAPF